MKGPAFELQDSSFRLRASGFRLHGMPRAGSFLHTTCRASRRGIDKHGPIHVVAMVIAWSLYRRTMRRVRVVNSVVVRLRGEMKGEREEIQKKFRRNTEGGTE
jgi:hypothetical protein